MNSLEILEMAAMIENKTSDIYTLLHERFQEEVEVARLFESLALEEEGHAGFLEAKIKMLKIKPDAFGTANVDGKLLEETFAEVERIERHIRDNPVTLQEAISLSLKIETQMVEEKYNALIEVAEPSLKKIFKSLTEKDNHIQKIMTAAKKLGVVIDSDRGEAPKQ